MTKVVGMDISFPFILDSLVNVSERTATPKPCSAKERALSPERQVQMGLSSTFSSAASLSRLLLIPVPLDVRIKSSFAKDFKVKGVSLFLRT